MVLCMQKGVDTWTVWYSPKSDFGVSTRDWGGTNKVFCEYKSSGTYGGYISVRHSTNYWDVCGRANTKCSAAVNSFLMVG